MKKIIVLFVLLTVLVTGCASQKFDEKASDMAQPETMAEKKEADFGGSPETNGEMKNEALEDGMPDFEASRKIIKTGNIRIETLDFDASIISLKELINDLGGYVFSVEAYDGSERDEFKNRDAFYVIKVPADKFDTFMESVNDVGDVINKNEAKEDVTSTYTDIEARLKTLYVQEDRLLEILKDADDLESVITLESALSDVRYEIEMYESSKRGLDERINYSEINVSITEVIERSEGNKSNRTFAEKVSNVFIDSLKAVVRTSEYLVLALVAMAPFLVILGVIGLIVYLIVRGIIKSNKKRKAKKADNQIEQKKEE